MNDNETQDDGNWGQQVAEMKRLSQRAAKLSERGAHYFVGWLIGAGMHKPAMMAEFEKVLTRLEKDPELSHCWRESNNAETPEGAAAASVVAQAESTAVQEPATIVEQTTASTANAEAVLEKSNGTDEPIAEVNTAAPEHPRSGMVKFETTIDPEAQERQGFFAKIFRRQRQRIAA